MGTEKRYESEGDIIGGTKAGGIKAAITMKTNYGADIYRRLGAKGGASSTTGGFYYAKLHGNIELVQEAGRRGGTISRRTKPDA